MINFVLAIISIVLFVLLEPVSFVYVVFFKKKFRWSRLSGYFRNFAIAIDRFGNFQYQSLFNRCLKKSNGYEFGDFRETVSSVLGKNQRDNTLTETGRILVKILNTIDKNHCENSIME